MDSPHYTDHLIAALRCLDDEGLRNLASEICNRLPDNQTSLVATKTILLETAAEYIAAMEYVQVLALRNTGTVHHTEIGQIFRKLPRFLDMPEELSDAVKRIRLERYNLQ